MHVRASAFSFLAALLCTGGCASADVQVDSHALARLAGRWQLDRQASDDVRARLLPLFERKERRWRRDVERFDLPPPGIDPGSNPNVKPDETFSNVRWLQGERQKEIQVLIAMLTAATQLDIAHDGRTIRIATNKGEGTRAVTPGESSALFLSVGGFRVSSMWEKGSLVIQSRGTDDNKMRIEERFTTHVDPSGERLEERLDVKIPGIGKQSFRFVYYR